MRRRLNPGPAQRANRYASSALGRRGINGISFVTMPETIPLTLLRRGAWIINMSRHLFRYDITDPRLSAVDNILFAGKCGSVLIKLSADETEQLTQLARQACLLRAC